MCGKYGGPAETEVFAGYFKVPPPFGSHPREDNMRPYKEVRVYVKNRQGVVVEKTMRWGFIPSSWKAGIADWTFSTTHARLESVADPGKCFSRAWHLGRRAIFPVGVIYERGWAISRVDGQPMGVAGVYDLAHTLDGDVLSVAMLTREPGPRMREIHDRESVVLDVATTARWLEGAADIDLERPMADDIYQAMPEAEWKRYAKTIAARELDTLPI